MEAGHLLLHCMRCDNQGANTELKNSRSRILEWTDANLNISSCENEWVGLPSEGLKQASFPSFRSIPIPRASLGAVGVGD
jgi:hypothetical protein